MRRLLALALGTSPYVAVAFGAAIRRSTGGKAAAVTESVMRTCGACISATDSGESTRTPSSDPPAASAANSLASDRAVVTPLLAGTSASSQAGVAR